MIEAAATPMDDTLCSICAVRIENYVPDYFLGEKFSPACGTCKENDVSWSSDEDLADHSRSEPESTAAHSVKSVKFSKSLETGEHIDEHFEEFLEHFEHDGKESKYSLLARNLAMSGERILDVRIQDIKSHSKHLNDSIDLCYKKAFPQLCSALRNFIRKKVDSDEAPKDFLVRLII